MRATLFALLVVASAACAKKSEPPPPACPEVVDHMLVIMKQGLTGHDSVNLGNRQQMIDQCEARKLSATERRCMLGAKDLTALASCRPRPAPTAPAGPVTVPPAPGSGG